MKNKEIASRFNEIADILELRGENRFRINAYRRGARSVESLQRPIEEIAAEGALGDIPGIGKDLEAKIDEYLEVGSISFLEELRDETHQVLLDMLRIPGIGPKTAVLLYEELKLESLADLKRAALDHRIQGLPKMKAKTEENILKGIEFLERAQGRTPIGEAYPLAERIISALDELPHVTKISPAGSLRRFRETIGDIDILATSRKPGDVIEHFTHLDVVERVLAEGKTKGSVITTEGIQVDLRVVAEASYGAALNYFTGSKEHNIRLREIAIKKKMKLNEYGLFKKSRKGAEKRIAGKTEEEVYKTLGFPYIPPEIREDTGEIEAAREGTLPDLVEMKDIRGDLHFHSNWSDGTSSLTELAVAGKAAGYRYLIVSDHSKSLHIAHGLSEDRLREQMDEIDRINKRLSGFKLLKGSEVDILPDGSLDLSDDVLEQLDIVIVAIHSQFKMKRDAMTARVITALQNPYANILAHPTGRLLGSRDAYEIDMSAVIDAAAETDTAIEINAHPMRLDLNAATARMTAEAGVMISIGTDAHNPALEMRYMRYGVYTARRGWLSKEQILNTKTVTQLLRSLHHKRKQM
ncbi:MAG: DNA polymerase/3'-5' exonuclease PolX [bacterium]|nr:MAG: DNA polymerase/3'-5' exonuclease PolX [bacterium]